MDGSGGVLHTRAGGFRVFRAGEKAGDLGAGERELHTDPPHHFSELFSLQTYQQNLQTRRLGQTVLYADVTSTTMDLLERYVRKSFTGRLDVCVCGTGGGVELIECVSEITG